MTNLIDRICWGVVGGFVPVAVWIAVSDVGRPSFVGQPALVNHAAYGVDGPAGFDQAQGAR